MQVLELFGSLAPLIMFSGIVLAGLMILVLSIINLATGGRLFQKIWPDAPRTPSEQKAFVLMLLALESFIFIFFISALEDAFGSGKLFWPATAMVFLFAGIYILVEMLFRRRQN